MPDRKPVPLRLRGGQRGGGNSGISLHIHSKIPGARIKRKFLLACARHGTKKLKHHSGEVNFILVGDREMSRLHREYSGISGTTDVLTFDLSENGQKTVEGDIYICLDQARRQAKEYGVPLYEETARLAVHGILHLAGLDDHSERDRANMRRLEDKSLAAARRSS